MAFKMKKFSGFKKEGPVKKDSIVRNYGKPPTEDPTFEYGFEESEKIMKLRRKGLIPGSKEFSHKAFLQSQNESEVKRSDLDAKGKKLWDAKNKKKK